MDLSIQNIYNNGSQKIQYAEHRLFGDPYSDMANKASSQSPFLISVCDIDKRENSRLFIKSKAPIQLQETEEFPLNLVLDYSKHRMPRDMSIKISNVVATYNLGCNINLNYISEHRINAEFKEEQNILILGLKKPPVTAKLRHTGSVTIFGALTADECHIGARRIARIIQKLGFEVRMRGFKVVNVYSSYVLPFKLNANNFAIDNIDVSCEPELHSCVIYKMQEPKATIFINNTGLGTANSGNVKRLYEALEVFYRMARHYAVPRTWEETKILKQKERRSVETQNMAKLMKLKEANVNICTVPAHFWKK